MDGIAEEILDGIFPGLCLVADVFEIRAPNLKFPLVFRMVTGGGRKPST
jgi:hypothetical protein